MRMIPHERSLVKRMQGRPFVLLGVNGDETREEFQDTIKEEEITWRNWWDAKGNIMDQYGVEGLPTIYLIDHKGMVRATFEGAPQARTPAQAIERLGEQLDKAIDGLVQEAERDAAGTAPAAAPTEKAP
jgi:hypothetical protein